MVTIVRVPADELWADVDRALTALGVASIAEARAHQLDCGCCYRWPDGVWRSTDALEGALFLLGLDWLLQPWKLYTEDL